MEHKEYTHLAVGTDDIVVKDNHLLQIEEDLEKQDYPVLCGMMNVYQEDLQFLNITKKDDIVSPHWAKRYYNWIPRPHIAVHTQDMQNPIIQTGFNGFALMVIRRDIVEKFDFLNDSEYNDVQTKEGGSLDVQFCYLCHTNEIPIMTDARVDMLHLRMSGHVRVGKKEPICIWQKGKARTLYKVQYKETIKIIDPLSIPGILDCTVCGGRASGSNYEEAVPKIDHAFRMKTRPCPNQITSYRWNGEPVLSIKRKTEEIPVPYLTQIKCK